MNVPVMVDNVRIRLQIWQVLMIFTFIIISSIIINILNYCSGTLLDKNDLGHLQKCILEEQRLSIHGKSSHSMGRTW